MGLLKRHQQNCLKLTKFYLGQVSIQKKLGRRTYLQQTNEAKRDAKCKRPNRGSERWKHSPTPQPPQPNQLTNKLTQLRPEH